MFMENNPLKKKIYYHDTDCGGVVYYANYLKYLEEARTEFFAGKGIALKSLVENGVWFVVARVEITYKAPARYQDILSIDTMIERTKISTLHFFQRVTRDATTIVEARTTLVCVDSGFKPRPLPEEIKGIILEAQHA